jgi:hypothetical protein
LELDFKFIWKKIKIKNYEKKLTYLETSMNCGGYYSYTISPNPAKENVTINSGSKTKKIKEVRIIDKLGNIKKTFKYSGNEKIVNLNISGLAPNVYYLKFMMAKNGKLNH